MSLSVAVLADCHIDHGHHGISGHLAWRAACESITERQPTAVIIAGDLFHTGSPAGSALNEAAVGIKRMRDADVFVAVLAGNHEWIGVNPPAARNLAANAITAGVEGTISLYSPKLLTLKTHDLQLALVPWHEPGTSLGTHYDAIQRLAELVNPELPAFAAAHAMVEGTKAVVRGSEIDFDTLTGETSMPLSTIDVPDRFRYTALGHIHRRQQITRSCGYVGSNDQITFADEGKQKGYGYFTWDDANQTWSSELVPIGGQQFRTITLTHNLDEIVDTTPGAFLRLELEAGELLTPDWQREVTKRGLRLIMSRPSQIARNTTDAGLSDETFKKLRNREHGIKINELLEHWLTLQTELTEEERNNVRNAANEALQA